MSDVDNVIQRNILSRLQNNFG